MFTKPMYATIRFDHMQQRDELLNQKCQYGKYQLVMGGCVSSGHAPLASAAPVAPQPAHSGSPRAKDNGNKAAAAANDHKDGHGHGHAHGHGSGDGHAIVPVIPPFVPAAPTTPPSQMYAIPGYSANAVVTLASHTIMLDSWKILLSGDSSYLRERRDQKAAPPPPMSPPQITVALVATPPQTTTTIAPTVSFPTAAASASTSTPAPVAASAPSATSAPAQTELSTTPSTISSTATTAPSSTTSLVVSSSTSATVVSTPAASSSSTAATETATSAPAAAAASSSSTSTTVDVSSPPPPLAAIAGSSSRGKGPSVPGSPNPPQGGLHAPKFSPALVFYEVYYRILQELHAPSSAVFAHGGVLRRSRGLLRMVASMLELDGPAHTARLQQTAAAHVHHGVEPNMYVAVLHALLLSLKELLSECWTKEVEAAWTTCCSFTLNTMLPTAIKEHRPVVVIVGGGYGGCMLAQRLSARRNARVVVLDRKKYWFHNLGGTRAVVSPEWINKWAFHPYNEDLLGCNTHFVSGDVTELTASGVHVHGWSAPLPYHYLVIATGSSYAFPGKLALPDRHAAIALYKEAFEQIKKSRRVVIVGGGPVGVELAGEIDDAFRAANDADAKAIGNGTDDEKKELPPRTITIIQRSSRLNVNFPLDMARLCESKLVARGVNVMLGTAANLPAATLELYHTNKVSYVAGHQIIPTSTGVDVECDLLFVCAGTQVNSKSFEKFAASEGKLTKQRRIEVGPRLQVGHYNNIFAMGDASAAEAMLVSSAISQAFYLAETIGALEEKREVKDYVLNSPSTKALAVSLGASDGVVLNPRVNGGVLTDGPAAVEHKSKDMSASQIWPLLNLPLRAEPNWNEKDVVNEDIQALSASMRVSANEARKILTEGLPVYSRASSDTYT